MGIKDRFWELIRPLRRRLLRATRRPGIGTIAWGELRRTKPISRNFGFDRGVPIDRFYIEQFLAECAGDVVGDVMEVGSEMYTLRFGGNRVTRGAVAHPDPANASASIVVDLTQPDALPADRFDCIICTQTLQFIYEVESAVDSLCRLLKPGGVLLLTCPGISQVSRADMRRTGDFWRFTNASMMRLLERYFSAPQCSVVTYGNVLTSCAFLQGVAVEELALQELEVHDPDFQLLVAARAVKI
jgi:SAM-dependent methyltransferase